MRISIVLSALNYGGAERQACLLACHLKKLGHEVSMISWYKPRSGEEQFLEALKGQQVPCYFLGKKGRWDIAAVTLRLSSLIRQLSPEVIYPFLTGPNIACALLKPFLTKHKLLFSVRASNMNLRRYGVLNVMARKVECWLSALADICIANSDAGKKQAQRDGYLSKNIRVIPNAVDTDLFFPDRETAILTRQELGVPPTAPLYGLAGRVDAMKGHEIFLQAAALVRASLPEARFICIGRSTEQDSRRLTELTEDLGIKESVIFLPASESPQNFYNALDVHVSASVFGEGFSNSTLEAMACGVPCVVTDVGDSALIPGETGLVVPPGDPSLLAGAMLELYHNQPKEKGLNARERVVKLFSPENLVQKTLSAILEA